MDLAGIPKLDLSRMFSPDELHAQLRSNAGLNGLVYAGKILGFDSPLEVLVNAIALSLGDLSIGRGMIFSNPQLPNDRFIIAVGHRIPSIPERIPNTPKK